MESKKCCFCGAPIIKWHWNNPEPLNSEFDTVCCDECNNNYVIPVRRVVWPPFVTKNEYNKLVQCFQSLELNQLRELLSQYKHPLTPGEYQSLVQRLRDRGLDL